MNVSVVIPAHNAEAYLACSLASALGQTMPPLEVIVVDDGSEDNTAQVVPRFGERVRLLSTPHRLGPAGARNLGVDAANGEFIAFLDADDSWAPYKLERVVPVFNRGAALVFSDGALVINGHIFTPSFLDSKSTCIPPGISWLPAAFEQLVVENFILTSSVVMRRSSFQEVGGFDVSLLSVEDRDLWLRVAARGSVWCIRDTLVSKTVREDSLSTDWATAAMCQARVMRKLDRAFPEHVAAMGPRWQVRLAAVLFDAAYAHRWHGDRVSALRCCVESFRLRPSLLTLKALLAALVLARPAAGSRQCVGGNGR